MLVPMFFHIFWVVLLENLMFNVGGFFSRISPKKNSDQKYPGWWIIFSVGKSSKSKNAVGWMFWMSWAPNPRGVESNLNLQICLKMLGPHENCPFFCYLPLNPGFQSPRMTFLPFVGSSISISARIASWRSKWSPGDSIRDLFIP